MSARVRATLLAAVLFIAFVVIMVAQPTGYAMLSPGPTVNILGTDGSPAAVTIKGHETYPDTKGELRMLTVYEMGPGQTLSLSSAIQNWLSDDTSVYPEDFLYPPGTTQSSSVQEGNAEMTSAQDLAKAAALQQAGIAVPMQTVIAAVEPKSPASGHLEVGDVVISVNGIKTSTPTQVQTAVRRGKPGYSAKVVVERGGKSLVVALKTVAAGTSGAAATTPRIGVSVEATYKFPFNININIPGNIMGPSAGMMFALTIYDLLTPGSLTDGHVIAGTGTIDGSGDVGAIGGIDQKIRAAQRDGAQLFLAPASNCDEVVNANYDHTTMKIVKVSTLKQAITAIKTWTTDPNASSLQGCS